MKDFLKIKFNLNWKTMQIDRQMRHFGMIGSDIG